jgi:hypothetical protein
LILEVPTSYEEYVKSLNTVILNHHTHKENSVSVNFHSIIYIKHWDWAISHLSHSEYSSINKNWQDLMKLTSEYNEIANSIKLKIEDLLVDSMKQHYPEFKNVVDINIKNSTDNCCYSISNATDIAFARMANYDSDNKPDFYDLNIEKLNDYDYVIISQYPIIRSGREEDLNIDEIRSILQTPFEKLEIKNRRKELDKILDEAFSLCKEFSKQLKNLIDDFNGGDVIKGRCKLGFLR